MKESTIIQNFQQLNNKYNKLIELAQKNLQQLYMTQTAIAMTLEALTSMLIDKGIMTNDDIKLYIEKEHQKRSGKTIENKEKEMETQPVIETGAESPIPIEGEI